ncbi:MAG: UbiX family flavin prenyltransferase [Mucinivorans sp.]
MRITVAITGASGAIYAERTVLALANDQRVEHLYIVCSKSGSEVFAYERAGRTIEWLTTLSPKIELVANDNFYTPIASGSAASDAMVVVPCSVGTLGRVAGGVSTTLIERTAAVQLKEGLPLVIVLRESPLSLIDLRNMVAVKEAGAIVMPAAPSFYSLPTTIEELADTVVERILDKISLKNEKSYRWIEK